MAGRCIILVGCGDTIFCKRGGIVVEFVWFGCGSLSIMFGLFQFLESLLRPTPASPAQKNLLDDNGNKADGKQRHYDSQYFFPYHLKPL